MQPRMILFAVALALASACSKKADPPAAPPAPDPKAAPPDDSACKLVSRDDAARLLGHPVGDGAIGTKPGPDAECHFTAASPAGAVDVFVFADGQGALRTNLAGGPLGKDPLQMPGIGTRAYRNEAGTAFGMLAKGKYVLVTATSSDHTGPSAANAQALATLLANRM